jgi:protein-L-isoaspartate O-methyltransferase
LGRVTGALARIFKQIHAYDISANHIELAKKRAADAGISNIEFHLYSAKEIVEDLPKCDFFYSNIIFQDNPPPIIRSLIQASLKALLEGSVAIFPSANVRSRLLIQH